MNINIKDVYYYDKEINKLRKNIKDQHNIINKLTKLIKELIKNNKNNIKKINLLNIQVLELKNELINIK